MKFCTVHTHSRLCDGRDTLADMAAAACAAGAVSFGASGHSHTPIPHDAGVTLPEDLTAYQREVLRLREEYAGRMDVLFGIEWDSLSGGEPPEDLDYWIGSVHNLRDDSRGEYHAVDWDMEELQLCRDRMFHGDIWAMLRRYYAEEAQMARRRPTILGHFDLITKYNGDNALFDEADARYRRAALDALHAADPAATVLEINTGAMARGYRTAPYPALFLLREWREMGGRVILTADAHSADAIAYGCEAAGELAVTAGFREHQLLTKTGFLPVPLENKQLF